MAARARARQLITARAIGAAWRPPPPPPLALLLGLTSFSAEGLVDHQCELLRVLLQCSAPHLSAQWLAAAFQHRALLEAVAPAGEANSELFLRLLVHRPPLKHDAIAREFSRMCRREGGVDGLGQFVPTA